MEFLCARDGEKDIEGYLFFKPDQEDVIIAFRGSETTQAGNIQDWVSTNARVTPWYFSGKKFKGNVHQGFLNAMYGVWHPNDTGLVKVLGDRQLWGRRFWVTGYSMGAAVATLVGMRLSDEEQTIGGIYTFGGPKLAQWDFQGSFNSHLSDVTHHFANEKDPIPRASMNLVAVGKTYLLDGASLRQVDKDGVPDWGLAGLFWGNIRAHLIGSEVPEGYLHTVRRLH
jgi:triacylglycerol lipase